MYQDLLIQHARSTRHKRTLSAEEICAEKKNPQCGDELAFRWEYRGEEGLCGWCWDGQGCAISLASASILCESLEGLGIAEARHCIQEVLDYMQGDGDWRARWGDPGIPALGAVRARPMRVACVTLAWLAVAEALAPDASNPSGA